MILRGKAKDEEVILKNTIETMTDTKRGERPGLGKIEVTPAMLEAGVEVLRDYHWYRYSAQIREFRTNSVRASAARSAYVARGRLLGGKRARTS